MHEWLKEIEGHATFVGIITLVVFAANQHKIWVRLKDRMNMLWADHCERKGEKYIPLENGHE